MVNYLSEILRDEPEVAEIAGKMLSLMQQYPRARGPEKMTAMLFAAAAVIADGQEPNGDQQWAALVDTKFREILAAMRAVERAEAVLH